MRKLLTVSLLVTAVFGLAKPAESQYISKAVADQHNALVAALVDRGVSVYLDADTCQENAGLSGFYHGASSSLVLCNKGSENMTAENMDTLRHESIHFLQDCKDGIIDGHLVPVLKPGAAQELLVQGGHDADAIRRLYTSKGRGAHVHLEEEAFGAAATMPAATIATAINTICPL